MKIILSRVGVDSSTPRKNAASPAFQDGRFYSIPIPYAHAPVTYAQIRSHLGNFDVASIAELMTKSSPETFVHLDPDLHPAWLPKRHDAWRPAYGQAGSPQGHLRKQGVGVGDLFLFYGRFQPVSESPWRRLRHPSYKNGDFQAVWAWLRVGDVVDLKKSPAPPGNADHPHCFGEWRGDNVLYLAASSLGLTGFEHVPGAGILPRLQPLTRVGSVASQWSIPRQLFTKQRQEHVADVAEAPEVLEIAKQLLDGLKP